MSVLSVCFCFSFFVGFLSNLALNVFDVIDRIANKLPIPANSYYTYTLYILVPFCIVGTIRKLIKI